MFFFLDMSLNKMNCEAGGVIRASGSDAFPSLREFPWNHMLSYDVLLSKLRASSFAKDISETELKRAVEKGFTKKMENGFDSDYENSDPAIRSAFQVVS